MAGRAAEALIFEQISTGASDDLVKCTEIARSMVVRFGMDSTLGQVAYEPERSRIMTTRDYQPRTYSEETAAGIDLAVRGLVEGAYALSCRILACNEALLRRTAADLLENEMLAGPELDAISAGVDRTAVQPTRLAPPRAAE